MAFWGRTMYSSAGERKDFADVAPVIAANGKVDEARSLTNAFSGDTIYAKNIRSRNALVKIGDTLLVHGGLGEWANQFSPGEINATIRAWTRYYQGVGPKPSANTNWVMGYSGDGIPDPWDTGPLWSTVFSEKLRESLGARIKDIRSMLAKMGRTTGRGRPHFHTRQCDLDEPSQVRRRGGHDRHRYFRRLPTRTVERDRDLFRRCYSTLLRATRRECSLEKKGAGAPIQSSRS